MPVFAAKAALASAKVASNGRSTVTLALESTAPVTRSPNSASGQRFIEGGASRSASSSTADCAPFSDNRMTCWELPITRIKRGASVTSSLQLLLLLLEANHELLLLQSEADTWPSLRKWRVAVTVFTASSDQSQIESAKSFWSSACRSGGAAATGGATPRSSSLGGIAVPSAASQCCLPRSASLRALHSASFSPFVSISPSAVRSGPPRASLIEARRPERSAPSSSARSGSAFFASFSSLGTEASLLSSAAPSSATGVEPLGLALPRLLSGPCSER
mmetsp:Transcript_98112/g.219806  ORF Transcript_98112/g.219806 Transcript_98112/m.219806 type:complete len:276 (-) Transcript_98112:446-1273(-)